MFLVLTNQILQNCGLDKSTTFLGFALIGYSISHIFRAKHNRCPAPALEAPPVAASKAEPALVAARAPLAMPAPLTVTAPGAFEF